MKGKNIRLLPRSSYFKNKRVLIRVDFNVDFANGKIIDDLRIRRSLTTIKKIAPRARYTLLVSHRGSFEKPNDSSETLQPMAKHLSRLMRRNVYFLEVSLESVDYALDKLPNHAIALLENIRWYDGERENIISLGKQLARLADVYVNDAFGESHRQEASLVAITKFLPSYAGFLLQDEISHLDSLNTKPHRPFVVILGGAKLKTKLPLIERFLRSADAVLVGTALANTFIAVQGHQIGKSLSDKSFIRQARLLLQNKDLFIPVDYVAAKNIYRGKGKVFSGNIKANEYIVDIGPKTIQNFASIIKNARTVFWNGPVGCFEHQPFSNGSRAIAKAVLNNKRAQKLIGGGDTLELLKSVITNYKLPITNDKNLFLSTGGGAMVQYLSGKKLPGVEALKQIRKSIRLRSG